MTAGITGLSGKPRTNLLILLLITLGLWRLGSATPQRFGVVPKSGGRGRVAADRIHHTIPVAIYQGIHAAKVGRNDDVDGFEWRWHPVLAGNAASEEQNGEGRERKEFNEEASRTRVL